MAYTGIDKSTDYFNTKLYTGSGSAQSLTGVGFQPDWIWIKDRSYADHHKVVDRVRWVSSSNSAQLSTNQNVAAGTQGIITSFDSDGFTLTTGDRGWNSSNNDSYASWNWKANGQGSSNTDGSINTTYTSASTTSGFSISQYTGTGSNATIGHGLGVAPKVVIIKNLSRAESWIVGHNSIGFTKFLSLDLNSAEQATSNRFNDTAPTNQVFSVGTADGSNKSGDSHVAYCFAEKTGFSKFGSYTGNGNANGPFIYTGFKPAFVMVKNTSNTQSWYILDNKRNTFNPLNKYMSADTTAAEQTATFWDYLSNGIKIRGTISGFNTSGDNYIYMAFAEAPLVTSGNIPATAR